VIFRRAKTPHKVEIATPTPWPANSSRNSAKVISAAPRQPPRSLRHRPRCGPSACRRRSAGAAHRQSGA
jgi:hypothetical protein